MKRNAISQFKKINTKFFILAWIIFLFFLCLRLSLAIAQMVDNSINTAPTSNHVTKTILSIQNLSDCDKELLTLCPPPPASPPTNKNEKEEIEICIEKNKTKFSSTCISSIVNFSRSRVEKKCKEILDKHCKQNILLSKKRECYLGIAHNVDYECRLYFEGNIGYGH